MNFAEDSLVCRMLVVPALLLILVSMLSDHEVSLAKFFSYNAHLKIDFAIGVALIAGPFIAGETSQSIPHFIFGTMIVFHSITSKKKNTASTTSAEATIENNTENTVL